MSKPTYLKKLSVDAISVVDAGSNPGAKTVLMKRHGGTMLTKDDVVKKFKEIMKKIGLGEEDITEDILKIEEATVPELKDLIEKMDKLETELGQLKTAKALSDSIGKISLEIAKAETVEVLKGLETELSKLDKNDSRVEVLKEALDSQMEEITKSAAIEKYSALLKGEKKKKFDNMTPAEKEKMMGDEPEPDGDEPVGKALIQQEIAKRKVLEAKIEKMEKENTINKIKATELKDMVGIAKLDELAENIYKARQSNPDAADALVTQMKALAAQVKAGTAFSIIGKDNGDTGSVSEKVNKMAIDLAKSKNITKEVAYDEVLKNDPELYTQLQAEDKARKAAL